MFEKSVTKKMQDVVLEGGMPAKEVCAKIRKPYSTLLRELNPFDTHAKLGAETLFDIIKATKNVGILEFMAQELGYTLIPDMNRTAITPTKSAAKPTTPERLRRQAATI